MNNTALQKGIASIAILCAIIPLSMSCTAKKASPAPQNQIVTIQRGNLVISVPVDGNLVMPQAFDLRFGTPGDVRDVFVEEGDFVKAGAVLARLDSTTQQLDIRSANSSMQKVLSNLYETVPRLPQFPEHCYQQNTTTLKWQDVGIDYSATSYPFYYPNRTALIAFDWAEDEVKKAHKLFLNNKYDEAESELYVAINDLETCAKIIEETIINPQSGLGGLAPFADQDEMTFLFYQDEIYPAIYILELRNLVEIIEQNRTDLEELRALIAQEKNDEAGTLFTVVANHMKDMGKAVLNNVNVIEKRHVGVVYGKNICLNLYQYADDSLSKAFTAIEKVGIDSPEFKSNLRVAQHQMALCNAILGSNDYVLQHGLSLKAEHQYKVDLEKSLVNLGNKQDDFLKTIILAPFDGTIVSVAVKKNDVLSAQDYSSKGTIQIVDTTAIKFEGLVDEIDILRVKAGQKANITVDAIPDKVFTGKVSFISPYGEASTSNVVKFAVTIQLDPTDVELKGGLTATADIAIETAENVLLLPLRAITSTPQGIFVNVIDEATGKTEKREVTLGRQNLQFAEVLSGINEGEKVVMEIKVTGAPIVQGFPGRPPPPGR